MTRYRSSSARPCRRRSKAFHQALDFKTLLHAGKVSEVLIADDQLAGSVDLRGAEELVFREASTGAENDLQRATDLARQMITRYGMSEALGPATLETVRGLYLSQPGVSNRSEYSERTAQSIDEEVRKLLADAQSRVRETLAGRRKQLEELAQTLLRQEVVDRATLLTLLRGSNADSPATGQPRKRQRFTRPEPKSYLKKQFGYRRRKSKLRLSRNGSRGRHSFVTTLPQAPLSMTLLDTASDSPTARRLDLKNIGHAAALLLILLAPGFFANAIAEPAASAADADTVDTGAEAANRPMEEIVVTAQRTSFVAAREAQKDAENIVNVLTYDEMRALPVINSGDAVRSIPGVQLETDTGEGRFVNIRGMDSDLNSTTFGGVRLPPTDVTTSPYGGSRAVSFDALPSEMIGLIVVTKTNRPEQEAEAMGGTIEITPKTVPLTGKSFGDIRAGSGLEPLRGTHVQDYAATVGGRFGAKGSDYTPFTAIGVFSFYKDARGVDDLEEVYTDMQSAGVPDRAQLYWEQRYYKQHKKRHVYGAEFGYAPSAENKWFFRYYDFGVVQDYNRNAIYYPFSGTPTVNPDGSFTDSGIAQKYYRSTTETFDTRLAQLGGNNDLEWLKLDYWIAHTQGLYNKPFDYKPIWQPSLPTTFTYNTLNSDFPSIAATGGQNPYDFSAYTLAQFTNSTQKSVTRDWQGKLNAAIPTHWTGYATEEVKFGVGFRSREFDQNVTTYTVNPAGGVGTLPALPLTPGLVGGGLGYYDNHYDMGPLVGTGYFVNAFANGTGAGFSNNPQVDAAQGALSTYNVKEDVSAGYAQYQFGFGQLGLFTGVRVEHTKEDFAAFAVNDKNQISPVVSNHSYTDVLPSLQTRYEFTPSLIGRAIYSQTIGRPGYNQLSPGLNINIPANLVSQGNPNLNAAISHNVDLSIEDYLPNAGILSFGVFYKDIKGYIVPLHTIRTFPNTGIFAGISGPIPVVTFENGSASRVLGYEFNAERRFRELPGFWSGFGASANWTLVDSRIQIRPGNYTSLPSTARNTGNAALFYEVPHRFDARVAANYISRSIFAYGTSPALDTWSEARTSLDLGAKYFVIDAVSVYFDAKNLTNTPLKYTEGVPGRPIQREFYGPTYLMGVIVTF